MLGKRDITRSERQAAKIALLAMLYGAGAPKVAESFTVNTGRPFTVPQAKVIRTNIKTAYPGLVGLMNSSQSTVMRDGFITNRWNRKLFVERERAYVATDYLIQSSGRDTLADAIISVNPIVKGWGGRIVLPIHDELIMWVPNEPTDDMLKSSGGCYG
jgi:DNA polymerase I